MNYLQLRSVTGTPQERLFLVSDSCLARLVLRILRRQAQEVIRMKRRANWMLCKSSRLLGTHSLTFLGSLILCSVAASQTFPVIIQSVWHGPQFWVPILISTVTMTIFVEIIPQYLIPQQAIAWGYYCWLVIWGCMWFTCIITFPMGWLLDKLQTKKDRVGIFTNDELQAVIQYHEQSEKRGGKLGQDAARIMRGALKLDSQRLSGDSRKATQPATDEEDVEKADSAVNQGTIVKWDAVKTVDINDTVDEAFIKKVQSWSYSRIPIIGKRPRANEDGRDSEAETWEGRVVFGFLYAKVCSASEDSKAI
jgi:metal transporter CNNM